MGNLGIPLFFTLILLCVILLHYPYHAANIWNPVVNFFSNDTIISTCEFDQLIKDFMGVRKELEFEYLSARKCAFDVGTISKYERQLTGYERRKWKMIPLKLLQSWQPNLHLLPTTTKLIKKYNHIISTAYYSILEPGKEIPFHKGPFKGVLRCHIPIIIPHGDLGLETLLKKHDSTGLHVIEKKHYDWSQPFIFDDTNEHRAWNRTSETRVVFIIDLIRPLPFVIDQLNRLWLKLASFNF